MKASVAQWDDNVFVESDEHPGRAHPKRGLPWLRMGFLSALAVAGLAYFAGPQEHRQERADPQPVPVSVLTAPAPEWKTVSANPAVFALEHSAAPVIMQARQHASGAREDTLILGRFGDTRHARITVVQGLAEKPRSFFVDTVRRAADAGLAVARKVQGVTLATKFGLAETTTMTLAGTVEQECRIVRFANPDIKFGFHGWLCGSGPVSETQAACFLDSLIPAGGATSALEGVFARAQLNRIEACGAGRTASVGVRAPARP